MTSEYIKRYWSLVKNYLLLKIPFGVFHASTTTLVILPAILNNSTHSPYKDQCNRSIVLKDRSKNDWNMISNVISLR